METASVTEEFKGAPMSSGQVDLSIIIVNWNSVACLRKCLASVYANAKNFNYEVIVIDNATYDGCGEMLRTEFPHTKFLQSEQNMGFAAANNVAFRCASGRGLLFLNPDTEVIGPAIQTMWSFLQALPDVGAVGCKLLNSDGSIQTSCIQRYPTILGELLDSEQLRRLFPRAGLWGTKALFDGSSGPVQVEVISGACLMIRRNVFERVGQFSTDYFMYAEDADLCFKAARAGCRNCYVGQATVIHHGSRSSDSIPKNNFAAVVMRDSLWKLLHRHRGSRYAAAYRTTTALGAALRILLICAALGTTLGQFRRDRLFLVLAKWGKVLRWSLGMEGWVDDLTHRDCSSESPVPLSAQERQSKKGLPPRDA